ncbi:hypothetical protein [Azorhizobium caulinodans]|uniref:hypothetical protein n=1 Tax=Azorhizobium caulinodans TaxID=7 RepID=UPI002FBE88BB
MHEKRKIIDVDQFGRDAEGNAFDIVAEPEIVAAGLMVNRPVTLRFPCGTMIETTQAALTPKGLEQIAREFPIADRETEGDA